MGGASLAFGRGKNRSESYSRPTAPKDVKPLRGDISNLLRSSLSGGFGQPGGIYGSFGNALFGQDFAEHGRKVLSGDVLNPELMGTIRSSLTPGALKSIQTGSNALREAAGPAGLRFGTDLIGNQGRLASDVLTGLNTDVLNAALPVGLAQFNRYAEAPQDFLNLLFQYATSGLGQSTRATGSGSEYNASITAREGK